MIMTNKRIVSSMGEDKVDNESRLKDLDETSYYWYVKGFLDCFDKFSPNKSVNPQMCEYAKILMNDGIKLVEGNPEINPSFSVPVYRLQNFIIKHCSINADIPEWFNEWAEE